MKKTKVLFVLHAHLPFVRHPELPEFLEERWLFEAISETYLPLLRVLDSLDADSVPCSLVLSVSPVLANMLQDPLLCTRYGDYLDKMARLAEKECERTAASPELHRLALMYREMIARNRHDFFEAHGGDLTKAFAVCAARGQVELITTAATHMYFPLFQHYPEAVRAQIHAAVRTHRRIFGKAPKGFWLPELAYYPGLEQYLKEAGVSWTILSAPGMLLSRPRPRSGVFEPCKSKNGLVFFGRDVETGVAVWSPDEGYPGTAHYRDFYRDIGFDLPLDYVGEFLASDKDRTFTGFKYWAVTGKTAEKRIYNPAEAVKLVAEQADNFAYRMVMASRRLRENGVEAPVIACPFDAELFGHWWFEGPSWINALCRKIAESSELELALPAAICSAAASMQTIQPEVSSWGSGSYSSVWLNSSNDWMYRHLHKMVDRMCELVMRFPNEKSLRERALNQAAREILLSQASDWAFIVNAGTSVQYAVRRFKEHYDNFTAIYESLGSNSINTEWLTKLEKRNNAFPDMDYRIYQSKPASPG